MDVSCSMDFFFFLLKPPEEQIIPLRSMKTVQKLKKMLSS